MNKEEMRKFYKLDPLVAEIIDEIQEEQNRILFKLPVIDVR